MHGLGDQVDTEYCRSGNFRVIKFSCLIFVVDKYFRGLGYPQKFFDGNRFYFPRFSLSGLEWDYACEEHEQLAAFVATM